MDIYTGIYETRYSEVFETRVNILKMHGRCPGYEGETCFRCGKPLKKTWYLVQDAKDDTEIASFGPDCITRLA